MKNTSMVIVTLLSASVALAGPPRQAPGNYAKSHSDAESYAKSYSESDSYSKAYGGHSDAHATGGNSNATGGVSSARVGNTVATSGDATANSGDSNATVGDTVLTAGDSNAVAGDSSAILNTDLDVQGSSANSNIKIGRATNNNTTNINMNDRIQHTAVATKQNCIKSTCMATNSLTITASHDDATEYTSYNIGVVIPFGGSGGATKAAMRREANYLAIRNQHEKERHQAEMAQVCMVLHELISIPEEGGSMDILNRCADYVPHKDHIITGNARNHNAGGAQGQVSPHAEYR